MTQATGPKNQVGDAGQVADQPKTQPKSSEPQPTFASLSADRIPGEDSESDSYFARMTARQKAKKAEQKAKRIEIEEPECW